MLVRQNLYGTYRLDGYPHGRHPPPLTFTESDDLVRLAEVGCRYQIAYTVGSGGGHRIEVKEPGFDQDGSGDRDGAHYLCAMPKNMVSMSFPGLLVTSVVRCLYRLRIDHASVM